MSYRKLSDLAYSVGLTLGELAGQMGLDANLLLNVDLGYQALPAALVPGIAQILGVDVSEVQYACRSITQLKDPQGYNPVQLTFSPTSLSPRASSLPVGYSQGAAPSRPFTPRDMRGCTLWLRGDLGITPGDGGGVAKWSDYSGYGNDVSQGTLAKQPGYIQIDAVYNNQSTLTFASASTQFLRSGIWAVAPAQPNTVFVVGNDDHIASVRRYTDGLAVSTWLVYYDGSVQAMYAGSEMGSGLTGGGLPHVVAAVFNGRASALYMSKATPVIGYAGTSSSTGITIGVSGDQVTQPLNGKIAEVIVYNRALSSTEVVQIMTYLGTRYAITIGP